jgi:hypothetical protein
MFNIKISMLDLESSMRYFMTLMLYLKITRYLRLSIKQNSRAQEVSPLSRFQIKIIPHSLH